MESILQCTTSFVAEICYAHGLLHIVIFELHPEACSKFIDDATVSAQPKITFHDCFCLKAENAFSAIQDAIKNGQRNGY